MRTHIKLEKLTGVVALAYLVLIPVGALFVWQKVKQIDEDVTTLWVEGKLTDVRTAAPSFRMSRFGRHSFTNI